VSILPKIYKRAIHIHLSQFLTIILTYLILDPVIDVKQLIGKHSSRPKQVSSCNFNRLDEIDRSHRVGAPKQNQTVPIDIIVKFISYRARQKLYTKRASLKVKDHTRTFIKAFAC